MSRRGHSKSWSWTLMLAAACLAAAGCDLLQDGDAPASDAVLAAESGDIVITLEWDNSADLDLHVTDPAGETIYFAHPSSASGGSLDADDTDGLGPETVFWAAADAPEGSYEVQVDHFAGPSPASYTVEVHRSVDPEEYERYEGTIVLGQMLSVVTFDYESPLPEPSSRTAIPVVRPKDRATRKP